jgi:hypothetical protein
VARVKKEDLYNLMQAYRQQFDVVLPEGLDGNELKAADHVARCRVWALLSDALVPLPLDYGEYAPPKLAQAWLRKAEVLTSKLKQQNPQSGVRVFWAGPDKARVEITHYEEYETAL